MRAVAATWLFGVVAHAGIIEKALFDLTNDPFELTDLSTTQSNEDLVNDLQLRLDQYRAESRIPVIQTTIINKGKHTNHSDLDFKFRVISAVSFVCFFPFSVWKLAGGVVPYANQTKPTKKNLPMIEAPVGAPNIVFMLLDDVGWNVRSSPRASAVHYLQHRNYLFAHAFRRI